jgi:hypothetical protein
LPPLAAHITVVFPYAALAVGIIKIDVPNIKKNTANKLLLLA